MQGNEWQQSWIEHIRAHLAVDESVGVSPSQFIRRSKPQVAVEVSSAQRRASKMSARYHTMRSPFDGHTSLMIPHTLPPSVALALSALLMDRSCTCSVCVGLQVTGLHTHFLLSVVKMGDTAVAPAEAPAEAPVLRERSHSDMGELLHSPSAALMTLVDCDHLNDFEAVCEYLSVHADEVRGRDVLTYRRRCMCRFGSTEFLHECDNSPLRPQTMR